MTERITEAGDCPITGANCACRCDQTVFKQCFIDVEVDIAVANMKQVAYNSANRASNSVQVEHLSGNAKSRIIKRIVQLAKKRIG